MEFTNFVRKPFVIEAVEVTTDNIEEIAEEVGKLREKFDGTPYIRVDRKRVPNIDNVYPGFYMTRMGDNIRCYSRRAFRQQFIEATPDVEKLVALLNDEVSAVPDEFPNTGTETTTSFVQG